MDLSVIIGKFDSYLISSLIIVQNDAKTSLHTLEFHGTVLESKSDDINLFWVKK